MNLLIHNEWQPDNEAMTMTVHVLVTDLVNFKMPRALPEGTKKFGDALKSFINHQAKEIPLSFQFELSKNDFLDLKDIDTVAIFNGLWRSIDPGPDGQKPQKLRSNLGYGHVRSGYDYGYQKAL